MESFEEEIVRLLISLRHRKACSWLRWSIQKIFLNEVGAVLAFRKVLTRIAEKIFGNNVHHPIFAPRNQKSGSSLKNVNEKVWRL